MAHLGGDDCDNYRVSTWVLECNFEVEITDGNGSLISQVFASAAAGGHIAFIVRDLGDQVRTRASHLNTTVLFPMTMLQRRSQL